MCAQGGVSAAANTRQKLAQLCVGGSAEMHSPCECHRRRRALAGYNNPRCPQRTLPLLLPPKSFSLGGIAGLCPEERGTELWFILILPPFPLPHGPVWLLDVYVKGEKILAWNSSLCTSLQDQGIIWSKECKILLLYAPLGNGFCLLFSMVQRTGFQSAHLRWQMWGMGAQLCGHL